MNQEIKHIWIDALTSGEYKQAQGVLRNGNEEYCCLGVLCDLHRKITGIGEWIGNGYMAAVLPIYGYLPDPVIAWSGLSDNSGTFNDTSLVLENDSSKPFMEIAELIEQYF